MEKLALEKRLNENPSDENVNSKYKAIKFNFEKYLELLNDKIIENIEQNMILKININF